MIERYGYALFHTSAAAFRAEKAAREAGAAGTVAVSGARLVPTPRALSSDCGVSLRFVIGEAGAKETARVMGELLDARGIPFDRIAEA